MKKMLISLCLGSYMLVLAACGDGAEGDIAEQDVPVTVRNAFTTRFPDAKDVEWERDMDGNNVLYKVGFDVQNKGMEATFDQNGGLVKAGED